MALLTRIKAMELPRALRIIIILIRRRPVYTGVFVTIAWGIGLTIAVLFIKSDMKASEWGDYFAGFLSPITLFWIIVTLFIQREELSLQRKDMAKSRQIAKEQAEEQRKTAEANLQANLIADRASFHQMSDKYIERIESLKIQIAKSIKGLNQASKERLYIYMSNDTATYSADEKSNAILNRQDFVLHFKYEGTDRDVMTISRIIANVAPFEMKNLFDADNVNFEVFKISLQRFFGTFDEFYEKAMDTNNSILVKYEDLKLFDAVEVFLKKMDEEANQ